MSTNDNAINVVSPSTVFERYSEQSERGADLPKLCIDGYGTRYKPRIDEGAEQSYNKGLMDMVRWVEQLQYMGFSVDAEMPWTHELIVTDPENDTRYRLREHTHEKYGVQMYLGEGRKNDPEPAPRIKEFGKALDVLTYTIALNTPKWDERATR